MDRPGVEAWPRASVGADWCVVMPLTLGRRSHRRCAGPHSETTGNTRRGAPRRRDVGPIESEPCASISKVLIANRGEIAVRIARACTDSGIASVAVYAEPDRDALHVKVADEAYALGGSTPGDSYLVQEKLLDIARQAGADAVHPGYGFLAENASFAQAVIDAGLIWIGPGPEAIDSLGDKVKARHIATKAGAPLVPGTKDPVAGADEVVEFAKEHGLPVAIKAAYGGGGRGLKVARAMEEIPDLYDSAVREAVTAFGRGECFVERFLDHPRHVETQCLADQHGNVVVVSTRDCSLQRRNQKLVEEAPAPFLTEEQHTELLRASKAILKEAGYVGAGTCEFLVGPAGDISFLEVNTRLQVEHPVTEEVTGIDLVREQFRIADGESLDYDDPRAARPLDRVPDQRRGRRPRLPARTGHREPHGRAAGPGRALGLRHRRGRHRRRGVRLDDRQAHRHRHAPASRPSSAPAGPWPSWPSRACRPSSPFHRAVVADPAFAPTDADEPFTDPHPLDRDRVRQHHRAVLPAARPTRTRPRSARPSSSRSAASGSRSRCPAASPSVVAAAVAAAKKKAPRALRWRQVRAPPPPATR